jgi:hypothetical protein
MTAAIVVLALLLLYSLASRRLELWNVSAPMVFVAVVELRPFDLVLIEVEVRHPLGQPDHDQRSKARVRSRQRS